MDENYDDIINLPHPDPKNHPRMSIEKRAAQFAPFAALTGHSDAIQEAGRLTDDFVNIGSDVQKELDIKMNFLMSHVDEQPEISITYFLPDRMKAGGEYKEMSGKIKKIDELGSVIILNDGTKIPVNNIIDIQSVVFNDLNI
jgi:hypothetical protein